MKDSNYSDAAAMIAVSVFVEKASSVRVTFNVPRIFFVISTASKKRGYSF
jgi:hypothetical protein